MKKIFTILFLQLLAMHVWAQAPTISTFGPANGPVGTLVTITGTNLSTPTAFTIGGTTAIAISNTGTVLVGMVMPGSASGLVSVTTAGGTASGTGNFSVTASVPPAAQQGSKLVGTGNIGAAQQGYSLSLSADGNTAIVGGSADNSNQGAAWVYTRSGGAWSQQGAKLVGTGNAGAAQQGISVSLSADGNTAIVGGYRDNGNQGATWIFTRSGNTWSQQGSKLVGIGNVGAAFQGRSVSLSADGNTAIIGGFQDNSIQGAVWIFTRSGNTWSQQGNKLVGTGNIGTAYQGQSVSLSADGKTAIVGGYNDNGGQGAAWIYTSSAGTWTQQGNKLVGNGNTGLAAQGQSVSISADGNTAILGGHYDNNEQGATWVFTRSGSTWSQQGSKLVGTGNVGVIYQGVSVSLSADGNTVLIGGPGDNNGIGASWIFTRSGSIWSQQGNKRAGTGTTGADQGFSVSLSADGNTAMAGGVSDNGGQGAVWVFNGAFPPVITSFSPSSGPIGTTVTISGTNFNATPASNIVFFGATRATVSAGTTTSLTVTVPVGATYQPISVLNTANALTGYSAKPFITTFTPNKGAIIAQDFTTNVDFASGNAPYSVAIGDLDGDGKPDLAVANSGSNTISVYRNISASGSITASSFAPKVDFATGNLPYSVAIGDLDGDGKADLAVANSGSNTVSVYRNISASGSITVSSFAPKVDLGAGNGPKSVAIGDLDGDGKADLAVTNEYGNSVSIIQNTSISGSITASSFAPKVDFVTGAAPFSVAIRDLDGDGKADLAVTNVSNASVSIFQNTSASGSITTSSFAAKVDFTTGFGPASVAIGDLDGDGKADLAVANTNSQSVSIFFNTSASGSITTSSFAAKVDFATRNSPSSIAIGDLDGDGKPDIAVPSSPESFISVLRNTAVSGSITASSFAAKVDLGTGGDPFSLAIGDLDGDGKADLAVANSSASVSVFRNNPIFPPIVTNSAATAITANGATLNGLVNDNGAATTTTFTYGTSPTLVGGTTVSSTTGASIAANTGNTATAYSITGLTAGTTYYFSANATNAGGATNGTPILSFTTITPPGNALDFDGTNDFVSVPNTGQYNFGTGDFTVELWFNTTQDGPLISNYNATTVQGFDIMINTVLNFSVAGAGRSAGSYTGNLKDGKWHHVAAVRIAGIVYLYIDGNVEGGGGGVAGNANSGSSLTLGKSEAFGVVFRGKMDEVRIYNIGLSAAQVLSNMTTSTPASAANLVSRYGFDSGTSGGNNVGVTTLYDQAAVPHNGTLTNFALTGAASNWVGSYAEVVPVATAATAVSNSGFTANWTVPQVGSADSYRLDVSTSATYATLLPGYNNLTVNGLSQVIPNLKPGTTYYYRVRAFSNSLGEGGRSASQGAFTPNLTPPGNSLDFKNAASNYIDITSATFPTGNSSYTIEAWVNPRDLSTGAGLGIIGWGNYGADNQVTAFRFGESSPGNYVLHNYWWNNDLAAPIPNISGKWSHVAATFNNTTGVRSIYLDGELIATDNPSVAGHNVTSTNITVGKTVGTEYFNGKLDEVRVYSTARTLAEIRADLKVSTPPATGLIAAYNFDHGIADGNNGTITTLYDLSAGARNGTLVNFGLTGTVSNFTGSYALVVPTATAATSLSNSSFTANWTPPLFGTADSYRLDVSTSPTFANTLTNYTNLTVAGNSQAITNIAPGTTYYYRVRAHSNSMNVDGGTSNIISAASTALSPPGNALIFDGSNDLVSIPDNAALRPATITVEAWVKPMDNTNKVYIKKVNTRGAGAANNASFALRQNGGFFSASMSAGGAGSFEQASQSIAYTIGRWYHLTAIYSATDIKLYVNGQLQQTTLTGHSIDYDANPLTIGGDTGGPYNNTVIDEVKLWNTDRGAQAYTDMTTITSSNAPGLIAYYNFDQGTAAGTNTGLTTLYDLTSNQLNGSLSNFTLTGTASNWVASYALVVPTANPATTPTNSSFTANWTAPATGTANSYRLDVSTSATFATILTNYSDLSVAGTSQLVTNIAPGTTYYYRVRAYNTAQAAAGGSSNIITAATTALTPPGNSLSFNGAQVVTIGGGGVDLSLTGSFSQEAWINSSSPADGQFHGFLGNQTGERSPSMWVYDGTKIHGLFYHADGSLVFYYSDPVIMPNKWYHVAQTFDGTNFKLYVNGENIPLTYTGTPAGTISPTPVLWIGRVDNFFVGKIDEVRLWNVARTAAEIRANYDKVINPATAGLLAYYDFDQGIAGGSNTGLTTLYDKTANAKNGTLSGFALTGSSTNYLASYALVVPTATAATVITPTTFTANWSAPTGGTADSYRLDVSANPAFTTFLTGYNDLTVNTTSLVVSGLTPNTTYYYRVRGYNTSQSVSGGSSLVIPVTTPATLTPTGNALAFDGSNDHVMVANRPVIFDASPFTIEAWIKTTGVSMGIVTHANSNTTWEGGEKAFYIQSNGSPAFVGFGSDYIYSNVAVNDGYWHHVSVTYNGTGGSGKIFVDGIDRTIISNYHPSGSEIGDFYLGRPNFFGGEAPNYFNGSLDDVRIWGTERTPAEIAADMSAPVASNSPGLVYSFNMDQGKNAGDNTLITHVKNNTTLQDPGVMTGFALSSGNTTSNFVGAADYSTLPPTAPTATGTPATQFTATWTWPVAETITSFFLDVSTDPSFSTFIPGFNNLDIGRVFDHQVTGLSAATQYYFRVRTYSIYLGASVSSATAALTTQTSLLSIGRAASQLTNAVFVDYTVKFAHSVSGLATNNFSLTQTGVTGAYVNSVTGSGTTYTVNVGTGGGDGTLGLNLASGAGLTPAISNALPFAGEIYTVDKTAPATPTNLTAVSGNSQNVINWTGNVESDLNKYNLYSGTSPNPATLIATLPAGTNTFTHTGLTNGVQYFYYIEAIDNATNISTPGTVIYQTPRANQTITFASTDSKVYGTADYNPGATSATSGTNTITYMSSNTAVATIVNGKVHVVGVGTSNITASQGGSTAYNAAPDVTQTLTITAKPVTVTADAKTKVYGAADPALTYSVSPALVAGDSFTGSLSRTGGENAGTYAINKNTLALSSNYTLTYVAANLTITAKPVTVTADAKTKVYGAADPALTYTFSPALVTGDSFTGSLSRTGGENAGNYTINQGTLSLSVNYTLSYVPANLTITAKPVTVTADAKTKVYGSADPALTYTVSPVLVAGDSFSGALSRTAGENTGSYAINKNTLALSSNYTLTYVSANLTITSKALTITADNKSRQQGVANPPLTASYSGFVNGETNAVLTTQPSLSTTATIASPQGNYPITPSGAAAQNYSIAYVNGTLSVTPGNVTSVSLAASALYENRPAGTLAGTLSSTSDDPNATFTYTLVSGTGSTDNASFSISGSQVLTTAPLNFENKPAYSIRVRSTTQFGLSLEQVFTINLLNVNEVPTISQVAEQITCYSANTQNIALAGISAGPDAGQSTALSFTNSNAGIFNSFSITNGTGGAGVISYTIKPGTSGIATITVTVQDDGGTANGGTDQTSMSFTLTVNALPVVNITSDKGSNDLSKGDVAILTATGGNSYTWATAAGIIGSQTSASLTVKPLVTTTYTVTATNTSGCSTSQSFTVNVLEDFKTIDAANIMSPNGDGVNDFWVVKNIELYPNNEVKVFDRAGRIVFSKKGYANTWDATVNGSPLAEGTYYYAIDFGAGKMIQKGFITVIRTQ